MELVIRQSERSGHQQRLLQAFTEDVFIFSLLVYIAHYSVLDDALYKFTYLLTVITSLLSGVSKPFPLWYYIILYCIIQGGPN